MFCMSTKHNLIVIFSPNKIPKIICQSVSHSRKLTISINLLYNHRLTLFVAEWVRVKILAQQYIFGNIRYSSLLEDFTSFVEVRSSFVWYYILDSRRDQFLYLATASDQKRILCDKGLFYISVFSWMISIEGKL